MSQFQSPQSPINIAATSIPVDTYGAQSTPEVSECAFEYLIGEILAMNYMGGETDEELVTGDGNNEIDFIKSQRLDDLGYQVGYRLVY